MNSPVITWYTKAYADKDYEAGTDFYAGTYTDSAPITLNIQLWNNRYGTEDAADLKDYDLIFYFNDKEDSALLDCCTLSISGKEEVSFVVSDGKAVAQFSNRPTLSGKKNNGDPDENPSNYIDLSLKFSASGQILKENDLKTLYLEVVPRY